MKPPKILSHILLLVALALLLSSCGISLFADRASNPIIQDWSHPFLNYSSDIFATKASHRLFMVQRVPGENGSSRLITCAEPSPDVAEAVATATADAFKIALQEPNTSTNVEAQNQYAHMLATEVAPLLYRTQGLQLYRNAASDLCVDFMNGLIDGTGYQERKAVILNKAVDLIEKELVQLDKTAVAFYKNFKTSGPKLSIDDVAKLANALEGEEPEEEVPPAPDTESLEPLIVEPSKKEIAESKGTGSIGFNVIKMSDSSVTFNVGEGAELVSAVDVNGAVLAVESDKKSVKITKKVSVTLSLANLDAGRIVRITISGLPSGVKKVLDFPVVSESK